MKYLERAYPWLLLAHVILPIVVWSGFIYPYLVPKTLFFYAISLASVSVFTILVAYGRAFFWSRLSHKEVWIPGALLVLAYIASIYGIGFYRSFWSVFVRGDGLLMLTGVVTSFYLILLSADNKFFERFLRVSSIVASFVATFGIGEWMLNGGRIGSLLGNAAFFAGYLGIAFFVTLIVAQTSSRAWSRFAYIGAGLQVVAIILSATRGTMLALGVALVAYLAYRSFSQANSEREKSPAQSVVPVSAQLFSRSDKMQTVARIALLSLVVIGGLFFTFRSELAIVPFAPVARVASISTNDPDVSSRLFIWKNMVTQIEKSPWLGVGSEHIDVLFNRFYDPTQISEQWFDRSHNAFLDYTAQYGIGGLLLYLALIGTFFIVARRFALGGKRTYALIISLLAGTYAIQNFFVFDTISSFWLILALLSVFISMSLEKETRSVLPLPPIAKYMSWIFALVFVALVIPVSIRPALAAYDLSHAYSYQIVDVQKEVGYLSHGFALGTYGNLEYGYQAYNMYVKHQVLMLKGSARVDAYKATLSILTDTFNRYTYDARTALYLASVLSLAPKGITVDKNLLSSALARAISLSPKRSQPWYILVNLSISNANKYPVGSVSRIAGYTAARALLSKYITLVPTLSEPHFVLAELLYASGKRKEASAEAALGKADYAGSIKTARRAIGYYENVGSWDGATFFLKKVLHSNPNDYVLQYDLAKVKYMSGDKAGALKIVSTLRKSDPTILLTDKNFLSAITSYEHSRK